MRKRSVRRYADGGAVPLDVEIDTPRSHVATEAITDQMMQAHEGHDFTPKVLEGDASVAFQGQIDALRKAEQNQREQNEQFQRDRFTMSREDRTQHWRDQGIGGADLDYMNALSDNPHVTVMAVADARKQGHAEDTDEFHNAVRSNFHRLLPQLSEQSDPVHDLEAAYQRGDVSGQADATKRISKAETARARLEDESDRARGRIVSAPVSRDTMGTGGGSYGDNRPGRVTLSIAQKEAAKIAGISEKEYAENVLRLRAEKAEGNYGGSP